MPTKKKYVTLKERYTERKHHRRERYAASKAEKNGESSVGVCAIVVTATKSAENIVEDAMGCSITSKKTKVASSVSCAASVPLSPTDSFQSNELSNYGIEKNLGASTSFLVNQHLWYQQYEAVRKDKGSSDVDPLESIAVEATRLPEANFDAEAKCPKP